MRTRFQLSAFLIVLAGAAQAQLALDSAADAVYTGGNLHGLNGGYGFGAWVATPTSNTNNAGNFQFTSSQNGNGSSGNIDSAGRAWGVYANSGATSEIKRSINVPMGGFRVVTLQFDNGWIDTGRETWVSIGTYQFGFTGGGADYWYDLGSGRNGTGLGFSTDGVNLTLTLNGLGGFNFSAKTNSSPAVWATANPVSGAVIPSTIVAFNNSAGNGASNNMYINNMKVVPEPASMTALAVGALALVRRRKLR